MRSSSSAFLMHWFSVFPRELPIGSFVLVLVGNFTNVDPPVIGNCHWEQKLSSFLAIFKNYYKCANLVFWKVFMFLVKFLYYSCTILTRRKDV